MDRLPPLNQWNTPQGTATVLPQMPPNVQQAPIVQPDILSLLGQIQSSIEALIARIDRQEPMRNSRKRRRIEIPTYISKRSKGELECLKKVQSTLLDINSDTTDETVERVLEHVSNRAKAILVAEEYGWDVAECCILVIRIPSSCSSYNVYTHNSLLNLISCPSHNT